MKKIKRSSDGPIQKLPRSRKTKAWAISVCEEMDSLISSSEYHGRGSKEKKAICYNLFNGKLNLADFEYVTNPYGFKQDELPANLQHYDFISPKISLLLGEEINRPFNFRVISTNPDATSSLEKEQQEMLMGVLRDVLLGYQEEDAIKEAQKYIKYTFQDLKEKNGQQALDYLIKQQHLIEKFNEGFKHATIAAEEIYWVGIVEGEPVCRVVNPLDITVVLDPESDDIENASTIIEERWLTLPSIIDEFHSELKDKDIKDLESLFSPDRGFGKDGSGIYDKMNVLVMTAGEYSRHSNYSKPKNRNGLISVTMYEWASFRKVYFITTKDPETGREYTELADEIFEVPDHAMKVDGKWVFDGMEVEVHWIKEFWTATKIHDDIYVNIGPKQNQRRSMDNPSKCKSSYIGKIYNAMNSESVSLVERMKTYQYLINIAYFRVEALMAKDKGKPMIVDLAQIPLSQGWDLDKWMYYLDAMGIAFINSFEEGEKGERSTFNQFTSIDMTTGSQINFYIQLIASLEDNIGRLVGVSRQREGQSYASELVGNVERSIQQSAHITEYWFYKHNECKRQVLEALIDTARIAWKNGKKINYVSDDVGRIMMDLDPGNFATCEYGVFVSNTTKDTRAIETMRSLAQAMLQNDKISAAELATIMASDNMSTVKHTLETAEENRQQYEQQLQQQQAESNKALQDQIQEWELLKIENENNQNDLDRQNKIDLELIKQSGMDEGMEPEEGGDPIQRGKLELDKQKHTDDMKIKKEDLLLKRKKLDQELALKRKEVSIKQQIANKPIPKPSR
jgi:hypothetical protein